MTRAKETTEYCLLSELTAKTAAGTRGVQQCGIQLTAAVH